MKLVRYAVFWLLAVLALGCEGGISPDTNEGQAASDVVDLDTSETKLVSSTPLTEAYDAFIAEASQSACRAFFEQMPRSFTDFAELYGYKASGGLYSVYPEHIEAMRKTAECVGPEEFARWGVNVSVNAKSHVDAEGDLQRLLADVIRSHPAEFCQVVRTLGPEDAQSVWSFAMYVPRIDMRGPEHYLVKSMMSTCPSQVAVARRAWKVIEAEADELGH